MRPLVFSLLLFAFIFTAAFLFTIAGERVGAVEDSQGLSRFAEPETVKTASLTVKQREGCEWLETLAEQGKTVDWGYCHGQQ
jgi:hypothetical protein